MKSYRHERELRCVADNDSMEKAFLFPTWKEVCAIKTLHQVIPFFTLKTI